MPKRSENKEYYAVIRGFYLTVPTIFSSWGDVHPLITGFSKPGFCGFATLAEAEAYMKEKGVKDYKYEIKPGAGDTTPEKGQKAYYAVANGREPGIREYYYGSRGVEPEVVNFQHACHKHFRTLVQAEAFVADWVEMYAYMVKSKIKEELLKGYQPLEANGLPFNLTLKTEDSGDEGELADRFRKVNWK